MIDDKEKKIKDSRTIEAAQKDLIGLDGKIGIVLKNLGEEIIKQDEGFGYLEKQYYQEEEYEEPEIGGTPHDILHQIPSMYVDGVDEEMYTTEPSYASLTSIGYHFDGLSRGLHLEIHYLNENSELRVTYQGKTVYKEIAGDLEGYAPGTWEQHIDALLPSAENKAKQRIENMKKDNIEKATKARNSWLRRMADKWGL